MALNPLSVNVVLDQLVCHDEGRDPGKGTEPYLWTYFFKVDGTTASLSADTTLSGVAVTHPTPGSHGNLGGGEVKTGAVVPIPATIGRWQTTLTAIPVAPELLQFPGVPDHIAGAIGVVLVLMEHDWTTDNTAEAGHAALNATLQRELNRLVDSLGIGHQQVSSSDIDAIAKKVAAAVTDAIKKQGGPLQDLGNLVNGDDALGADAAIFTHTELEATPSPTFSRRFKPEKRGDWEVRGHVTAQALPVRPHPAPLPRG
jgi:hypothetical protein